MPTMASSRGSVKKSPSSKVSHKADKSAKKTREPSPSSNEDSDSENGGVDEEGMERLMKALGDDGLDEFDQVQLHIALGDDDEEEGATNDEEDAEEGEEAGSGTDSEAGEDDESDAEEDDNENEGEAEDEEDEDDEELANDIPLDEVESVDEDTVPRQKVEIDNKEALDRIRDTIQLDPSLPWTETLTLSYPHTIDVDVNDDLNRELAFYKQALHSANAARALAAKHSFPFTRPSDYFAEMVKSDAHMERIRQRLLDEGAGIKKSEEKRKEREGKKFGKQVQIEKLKERERGKKEMEERLKGLKRKRKDVLDKSQPDDDAFDVAVEDAISDRPAKRGKGPGGNKLPRTARDQKFGFGGAGRRSKSNTRESTDDFDSGSKRGGFRGGARGGSGRGGRGGSSGRGGRGGSSERGGREGSRGGGARGGGKRLGKSRRITARSKQ